MDIANIWNKLHIYRYKTIAIVCFLLLFSFTARAQRTSDMNMPSYDDKPLHYGFHLGINYTNFLIKRSDYLLSDTTFDYVNAQGSTGFTLGFIVNLRLTDFSDLRLLPTVAFYQRNVVYGNEESGTEETNNIESTYVEFPLLFKYKSDRRKNNKFYMVAGLKPGIEVGAKKKERRDTQLRVQTFDLSLEYGLGLDIYNEMFKFAPEVRFSLGIMNLLSKDPNIYANSLDRMSTFTVLFTALFE